jgi:hypothetical protein
MSVPYRVTVTAAFALAASAAVADGIDPGLWKIISRTETAGVIGPPHESSKCLTASSLRRKHAARCAAMTSACANLRAMKRHTFGTC